MSEVNLLELDRSIAKDLPRAWSAFFERFGRLTPVQRAVIPHILEGEDILVSAATASGKTEAVCAPLLERFIGRATPWTILYVCPTRALTNDIYLRLVTPLERLGLNVVRRTGEHHQSLKRSNVIITTPESLDSLLCRGRITGAYGHALAPVVAVVLDEVHFLHNSARGEQLSWLLERLKRLKKQAKAKEWIKDDRIQIIALSATVPDLEEVCRKYLNNGRTIQVSGSREIEAVQCTENISPVELALPKYLASISTGEKVLVFSNSRKRVDALASALSISLKSMGYAVLGHHGSLSKAGREEAEEAAKTKERMVFCATSTLEIGIDIGDVNLVVLDEPAPDVSSFLQRIGRGNRRTSRTRVMLCGTSHRHQVIHSAMLDMARQGWVGEPAAKSFYAVARQQVASYIFQAPNQSRGRDSLLNLLSSQIDSALANSLIDWMLQQGDLRIYGPNISLGEEWLEKTEKGEIHSNIESTYGSNVIDDRTGDLIASGVNYRGASNLDIAGKNLKVQSFDNHTIAVRQVAGAANSAGWDYSSLGRAPVDGQAFALKKHLGLPDNLWPYLSSQGKQYVFHLGGVRRYAIIEAMARTHGVSIKGNEFWFSFEGSDKPTWAKGLLTYQLEQYVRDNLDRLESRLNRLGANKCLPNDMREREISNLLCDADELKLIAVAHWEECDPQIYQALHALIE